nr:amidohydrolase family protein [Streptomyces sp. SPB162]
MRTATVAPAELFGVGDDLGTLEAGKLADLTVIDGNPFQDFDDLVRTTWVMRDGIVYRQDDLVAEYGTTLAQRRTTDRTDRLDVSRRLRREPCCSQHAFPL